MSDLELGADNTSQEEDRVGVPRLAQAPTGWYSRSVNWLSECFSSISVKETRQSLKSYQFFGTYLLLVLAVSIVTILILVTRDFSQTARYDIISVELFYAYLMILGLPLCVIIPFSAYRSLSREYEDGTIQLMFITTMRPYQIVLGKLGTAMLQMVIYLSVVAPCLAIIYMLEGITFGSIALALGFAVAGCILLTIFGLLLAGAFKSSAGVLAVSTIFVLALGGLYLGWWSLIEESIGNSSGMGMDDIFRGVPPAIVQVMLFIFISFFGSTACLMLAAAASQISFASDNRSTPVRLVLLFQLPLFLAAIWVALPGYRQLGQLPNIMMVISIFVTHYWMIIGFMMAGERPGISRRVQRSLPKSLLGRSLKSLLMPGSGRGLLFVVAGTIGCMVACLAIVVISIWLPDWMVDPWLIAFGDDLPMRVTGIGLIDQELILVSLLKMGIQFLFGIGFVSIIFLVNRAIGWSRPKQRMRPNIVLTTVLGVFLVFGSIVVSLGLWQLRDDPRIRYGSFYQAGNYRSLTFEESLNWYIVNSRLFEDLSLDSLLNELITLIPVLAFLTAMIAAAVVVASRELRIQPISAPSRVVEDIEQERKIPVELPPGESIDEILGIDPDQV
jgi:hypothetical protein